MNSRSDNSSLKQKNKRLRRFANDNLYYLPDIAANHWTARETAAVFCNELQPAPGRKSWHGLRASEDFWRQVSSRPLHVNGESMPR
jgi:hypothetical protein